MITVYNRQRTVPVDRGAVRRDAELLVSELGYAGYELNIVITNNATIRRYNRQFRSQDKATDILSFPAYPAQSPEKLVIAPEDELILGDLLISAPYVQQAAEELGMPFEVRMRELLVHGILHLLGYDHQSDEDFGHMSVREQALLRFLEQRDAGQ